MNIFDKHRALIVNAMSFASPVIDLHPEDGSVARIVGDPTQVTKVKLVFPDVAGLGGREIFRTLQEMVETTAGVIESFEALCAPAG